MDMSLPRFSETLKILFSVIRLLCSQESDKVLKEIDKINMAEMKERLEERK